MLFTSTEISMAAETGHLTSTGTNEKCECEDTLGMNRKMKVRFSLSMLSEEDLQMDSQQPELEDEDIEDDCFVDGNPWLVPVANMSFALTGDQGSDPNNLCGSSDQHFNEIVVTSEQADWAFISAQIGKLIKEKNNLFMKPQQLCKFVASGGQNQIYLEDTMTAKITIFHVMATKDTRSGVPVVLNFSGTENFFCCNNEGEGPTLTITTYDKNELRFSTSDSKKSSLVFYMSRTPDGFRHFESVLYRGWFIHSGNSNMKMKKGSVTLENCFDIIDSDSTKTIKY